MKVTVYGAGYVGLVQAAVLSHVGHEVVCVDTDILKVANLNKGIIHIHEPGLNELVTTGLENGLLSFTSKLLHGIEHSDIQMIAVGTPPNEDGSADLHFVMNVATSIAAGMTSYKTIVSKSTVPVGTADAICKAVAEVHGNLQVHVPFEVASNPEFLKEGDAINDCMHPDRIVIGSNGTHALTHLRELYAPFTRDNDCIITMDTRSAELTKYAANCMLATKISFINEMANIAELVEADIDMVRKGIGADPRIGYEFLRPGCGYGGSCFPKDVKALISTSKNHDYTPELLNAVDNVNTRQKCKLFEYLQDYFVDLKGKTIALWGLSFKPGTNDMREASSRVLMEMLWEAGANVQAYDPLAMGECERIYGKRDDLSYGTTRDDVLVNADALVICTEWDQFKSPDFAAIEQHCDVIFDGRNLYNTCDVTKHKLQYYAIGR